MNKKNNNSKIVKKITYIAILACLASIFSLLDRYISNLLFPYLTGVKIGIANIIVLIAIQNFDFKDNVIIIILKSLLGNLLFFGLISYVISQVASIISFLVMYLIYKYFKKFVSMIGISILGGMSHTLTQLIVISLMYSLGTSVYAYGLPLLILSLLTSVIMGIMSIQVNKLYVHIFKIE